MRSRTSVASRISASRTSLTAIRRVSSRMTAFMGYLLERLPSAEPASEESEGAVPCLLRPHGIVLGGGNATRSHGGLVGEGVVCQVAMEIESDAGSTQLVLQRIDGGDRKELILGGPMPLQRRLDLGRIEVLERRAAVP